MVFKRQVAEANIGSNNAEVDPSPDNWRDLHGHMARVNAPNCMDSRLELVSFPLHLSCPSTLITSSAYMICSLHNRGPDGALKPSVALELEQSKRVHS